MSARYASADLVRFASELLLRAGLDADKAETVARILVEGDLLGHTTHGLQLLAPYLKEIESGSMAKTGSPRVIADFPAALTWDGMRLPGPWLVVRAIAAAAARAKTLGTGTVVIRRSHHIACLAAYLRPVADQGLMILLASSDPTVGGVAPHGGRRAVFTPNPIAAAWPTAGEPVIMDVSQSITSLGGARRAQTEGRKLAGQWAIDSAGNPTDDPAAVFSDPPGALLPSGGIDHGHKGYAFGLLVEALTGALAGQGRAAPAPEKWSATVFVQVLDPALFGGVAPFVQETSWIAKRCQETPPRPGVDRVRVPGEAGSERRARQLANGLDLYPEIIPALTPWAHRLDIPLPIPLAP
jgi:LDH2 family malate/lactate/ureidoglycolate dehydrogenase